MSRVALLSSEPLRERMAGIGIRGLEIARVLAEAGLEVVMVSPTAGDGLEAGQLPPGVVWRAFDADRLGGTTSDCTVAVAQGQLANESIHRLRHLPQVIDLYDPWLVENLHYASQLGNEPYRNDHRSWLLQMSRGDFFLCSSDEQRLFFLGFLTALGRVNPESIADDADLRRLIAVAPFGQPSHLPDPRPVLGARKDGERRLLFGGLYDWYDPWPLLEALESLEWTLGARRAVLYLVENPNPGTPQRLFAEVEAWCRARSYWQERVRTLEWVPYERRYDLLRDVDLLVATHRLGLETRLSMRTRFLDALRVGVPVLTSEGGTISRLLVEEDAGWVVPESSASALEAALEEIFCGGDDPSATRTGRIRRGQRLAEGLQWRSALAPLVEFCRAPRFDPSKDRYVHSLATSAPDDSWLFRARRRWRRRRSPKSFGGGGR